jgi:hypothetical protein
LISATMWCRPYQSHTNAGAMLLSLKNCKLMKHFFIVRCFKYFDIEMKNWLKHWQNSIPFVTEISVFLAVRNSSFVLGTYSSPPSSQLYYTKFPLYFKELSPSLCPNCRFLTKLSLFKLVLRYFCYTKMEVLSKYIYFSLRYFHSLIINHPIIFAECVLYGRHCIKSFKCKHWNWYDCGTERIHNQETKDIL